jgi:hypothetical protein
MPSAEQRARGLRYVSFLIIEYLQGRCLLCPVRKSRFSGESVGLKPREKDRQQPGFSPGISRLRKSPQAHTLFLLTRLGSMEAMSRRFELGVAEILRSAEQFRGWDNAPLRQIKCHTLQSNFSPKLLKTKVRRPLQVTHFFRGRTAGFFASSISNSCSQGPHAA